MFFVKGKITVLENKITQHQEVLQKKEEEEKDIVASLLEQKKELDDHKDHVKLILEAMETEREINKQRLHSVEKNISESESELERLQELLKEKEDILQIYWKLEQDKNYNDTQLLHTDRLLELIEIQIFKITNRDK